MQPRSIRATCLALIVTSVYFAAVAATLQWARTDLDPVVTPLSSYLIGPGGGWLRSAYYAIAVAICAGSVAGYALTAPPQRSLLAALLFAGAGLALPVVAVTETLLGSPHENAALLIHGLAAQATFLWLSFATLLLSHRWRRDPRLRKGSGTGVALAWVATAALWTLVLARNLPHGLMQKLAIALILLWLFWAARHAWRAASLQSAR